MPETNRSSGALGFTGALFLVFLVLKLTRVIAWSWWWITAPLWGGLAIAAAVLVVGLIVVFVMTPFRRARLRRNRAAWEAKREEFKRRAAL